MTALLPRLIGVARAELAALDRRYLATESEQAKARQQATHVLLLCGLSLLLIHYLKFSSVFRECLQWLSAVSGLDLWRELHRSGYAELAGEAWWGLWHLVGFVLLPWLWLRSQGLSMRDAGMGGGDGFRHWRWYLLLALPVMGFAALASFRPDFAAHYPFYSLAGRSGLDFLLWQMIYLGQFVCLEFFFRGFMLQRLAPTFGVNAVFVMCLPYLMIHFPKLWLEATGALFFGVFLGLLALKSRSIWGGVAVHAGVALSMDIAALLQGGGLPGQWLP